MLRLYHVLLGFLLIPIGVTVAVPYFSKDKKSEPSSIKTPTPAATLVNTNKPKPKPNKNNIWNDIIPEAPLPTGWKINPCENNNSLLCVSANGKPLGTVKMEILPLKAEMNFQKILIESGIPANSNIDYRSPKYLSNVTIALKAWVNNRYKVLAKNSKYIDDKTAKTDEKTAKTADGVLFSAYPLQKARVGKLEGIRYGFAELKQKGGLKEQHTSYVAFDGKALYLIDTAFNSSSSTGNFDKLENLSVFQPYLNTVVANLKLPK